MKVPRRVFVDGEGWKDDSYTVNVAPACDNKNGGAWMCLTHNETFLNQMQKDSHIRRGRHVLAWVCMAHGPEVP